MAKKAFWQIHIEATLKTCAECEKDLKKDRATLLKRAAKFLREENLQAVEGVLRDIDELDVERRENAAIIERMTDLLDELIAQAPASS